jgi:hypothetical protein
MKIPARRVARRLGAPSHQKRWARRGKSLGSGRASSPRARPNALGRRFVSFLSRLVAYPSLGRAGRGANISSSPSAATGSSAVSFQRCGSPLRAPLYGCDSDHAVLNSTGSPASVHETVVRSWFMWDHDQQHTTNRDGSDGTPQSCSTTLRNELLIVSGSSPSYSMKPSFLNLFKKKFTRDRVVPTIFASVSCEIRGTTRAGLSCLP